MSVLFLWGQQGLQQQKPAVPAPGKTRRILAKPALFLGVVAIFAFSGEGVIVDWAAIYMKHDLAANGELALMGYAAFAASMAIMRFAGDPIRHKFRARALVCTGGLIAAFGLMIGPLSQDPAFMIAGCAIAGAGLANIVPVLFSLAGALPRPEVQIGAVSTMDSAVSSRSRHYWVSSVSIMGWVQYSIRERPEQLPSPFLPYQA
jgi:hypothetical protein